MCKTSSASLIETLIWLIAVQCVSWLITALLKISIINTRIYEKIKKTCGYTLTEGVKIRREENLLKGAIICTELQFKVKQDRWIERIAYGKVWVTWREQRLLKHKILMRNDRKVNWNNPLGSDNWELCNLYPWTLHLCSRNRQSVYR